ncbi:uncharacterized protein LOC115215107 [Octopus sinensis]|uniref:Uncharacterized protein LOC115215107 n=1 Tax=Octopus sinensis TaxID=2607531 RepID=A0A6P7SPU4_9MOLL|nr:uncharacterized protein LOC115215107 [Octopus sinensis]
MATTEGKTTFNKMQEQVTPSEIVAEDASQLIWQYMSPLLLALGTIGSVLSICVLLRPKIRKITSMYLLTLLSFADLIGLWLGLLRLYLSNVYNFDIRLQSDFLCKIHTFLVYFVLDLGSWLLALIAIERFLLIVRPFIARDHWNRSKATLTVIATGILLTIVNGHYIITYRLTKVTCAYNIDEIYCNDNWDATYLIKRNYSDDNEYVTYRIPLSTPQMTENVACKSDDGKMYFYINVFPWIDFLFFFFLPFCIMVISHVFIIGKVRKTKVKMQKKRMPRCATSATPATDQISTVTETTRTAFAGIVGKKENTLLPNNSKLNGTEVNKGSKERQSNQMSKVVGLSAMLLSVLVAFGLTTSPITSFLIWSRFDEEDNSAYYNISWAVVNMVQYTNNVSHFFLFILTGTTFRQELLQMFRGVSIFFRRKTDVTPFG